MWRHVCLLAFITAVAVYPAHAQLKVVETTQTYSITGTNAAEFAQAMTRNGPTSTSIGRRAWATASHRVNYDLREKRSGGFCRVGTPKVTMRIVVRLPKLKNPKAVKKASLQTWVRMRNILQKHEAVHVRYYRQLATEIDKALRRLSPQTSCQALKAKAAGVVRRLKRKNRAKNERFDARDFRNVRRMRRLYSGY